MNKKCSITIQVVCTRWGKDPLSFGSYSSVSTGSPGAEDYDRMAESEGSRVFFAGEATTRKYPATMHGAYISGLREAANISATLERLKREKQWENGATEEDLWMDRGAGRTLTVEEKLQTGRMLKKVSSGKEYERQGGCCRILQTSSGVRKPLCIYHGCFMTHHLLSAISGSGWGNKFTFCPRGIIKVDLLSDFEYMPLREHLVAVHADFLLIEAR